MKKNIYINDKLIQADVEVNVSSSNPDFITIEGEIRVYNYDLVAFIKKNPFTIEASKDFADLEAVKIEYGTEENRKLVFIGFFEILISKDQLWMKRGDGDTVYRYTIAVFPKNVLVDKFFASRRSKLKPISLLTDKMHEVLLNKQSILDTYIAKYGFIFMGSVATVRGMLRTGGLDVTEREMNDIYNIKKSTWFAPYRNKTLYIEAKDIFYNSLDVSVSTEHLVYKLEVEVNSIIVVHDIITFELKQPGQSKTRELKLRILSADMQVSNFKASSYILKGIEVE